MQFALTYAAHVFDTRERMMGRQSAGMGFLRAALAYGPERIWCHAQSSASAQIFGRDARALSKTCPELRLILWNQPARLTLAGTLYRADPGVGEDAWRRQTHAGGRSYSLCGVTHTLSTKSAMAIIPTLLDAPLYPWDAVICTSTAARDVLRHSLEASMEHRRRRLGATIFTLPQFPLIPLGVHSIDFVCSPERRAAARADFGLAQDDTAVLFAGRLSFHVKAHPLPMFLGLEAAARATGKRVSLVLFGQWPNAEIETAFREEAVRFAPSIRLIVLDGKEDLNREHAFAMADIFTSLSDNIQETFGLTPIEGMAAGLPVVVSDWDGYKDTVRDGIDGFRIPTTMPPPETGGDLADLLDADAITYDTYVGSVSLLTAVDHDAAARAYQRLIESPDLRRRMGESGRRRVAKRFEWSVVFRRYVALWEELAERRRADPTFPGEQSRARRPDRPDPFARFRTYPTNALGGGSRLRLRPGIDAEEALSRLSIQSVGYAAVVLPPRSLAHALVDLLGTAEAMTVEELSIALPGHSTAALLRAAAVLMKLGVVAWFG